MRLGVKYSKLCGKAQEGLSITFTCHSVFITQPYQVQFSQRELWLHPYLKKGNEETFREYLINDLITAQAKTEAFAVATAAANSAWSLFATEMRGKFASRMREIPNLSQRWDMHWSTWVCKLALNLPNPRLLAPSPSHCQIQPRSWTDPGGAVQHTQGMR